MSSELESGVREKHRRFRFSTRYDGGMPDDQRLPTSARGTISSRKTGLCKRVFTKESAHSPNA